MNFESIDLINKRKALLALSRQNSPLYRHRCFSCATVNCHFDHMNVWHTANAIKSNDKRQRWRKTRSELNEYTPNINYNVELDCSLFMAWQLLMPQIEPKRLFSIAFNFSFCACFIFIIDLYNVFFRNLSADHCIERDRARWIVHVSIVPQ